MITNYNHEECFLQDEDGNKIHPLQLRLADALKEYEVHGCGDSIVKGEITDIKLSVKKSVFDLKFYVGNKVCTFLFRLEKVKNER